MKTHRRTFISKTSLICITAAMAGSASGPARADSASPQTFAGTWKLAGIEAEEEGRKQAVESALKGVPGFARKKARRRLHERTAPSRELTIELEGNRLGLSRDGRSVSLEIGGEPVPVENGDKKAALSARMEGDQLVLVSDAGDGKRVTTYSLSSDQQNLKLSVEMTGKRLSAPVSYETTYRRR